MLVRGGHRLAAVASRDKERAQALLDKVRAPPGSARALGSYDALMSESPDVDIVYVGTINPCHAAHVELALRHGKHVLCEKPMTLRAADTERLVALAREKGLFLMEGFWSRLFPAARKLVELVAGGKRDGAHVVTVRGTFGVPIAGIERVAQRQLGGGGHMDIGCYFQQFCSLLLDRRPIDQLLVTAKRNDDGVDVGYSVIQVYAGSELQPDATATFSCSVVHSLGNELEVTLSNGRVLTVRPLWIPQELTMRMYHQTQQFHLPTEQDAMNHSASTGFRHEIEHVEQCLRDQLTESPVMPLDESIELARTSDRLLAEMGVSYDGV